MWFNILKIEDRRAAYRLLINSMVHLGELILPKPPTEVVNEGGVRSLVAETPNGHFEWGQEFNFDGTFGKFYLASVPYNYEAHTDYIEGMFEQETQSNTPPYGNFLGRMPTLQKKKKTILLRPRKN